MQNLLYSQSLLPIATPLNRMTVIENIGFCNVLSAPSRVPKQAASFQKNPVFRRAGWQALCVGNVRNA